MSHRRVDQGTDQVCILPELFRAIREELRRCVQYLTDLLAASVCLALLAFCVSLFCYANGRLSSTMLTHGA